MNTEQDRYTQETQDIARLRDLESQDANLTSILAEIVTKAALRLEGKNK
ncbi:hypothetical protein [Modicisalibacter muralis]|nr:hypothetical protein [Halomonas muralis]